MPRGPLEATGLVSTVLPIDGSPRLTRDVLIEILVTNQWFSRREAEDRADIWLSRFIRKLELIISESQNEGNFCSFAFNSSGADYLQGNCFCEPSDPPEIRAAKRNRASTISIYSHFIKLSANEFELLSGKILELLKVEKAFVSRRSTDQGIDFFGRVPFGEMLKPTLLNPGAEKNFFVWLVGQSKHYQQTKVSTSDIRELVGSIELARAKVFSGLEDPLSDLKVRLCDPIVYLSFTSGIFTRGSKDLLTKSGVLSFNGMQIGQFLADHGVGLTNGNFDPAAFTKWLVS